MVVDRLQIVQLWRENYPLFKGQNEVHCEQESPKVIISNYLLLCPYLYLVVFYRLEYSI